MSNLPPHDIAFPAPLPFQLPTIIPAADPDAPLARKIRLAYGATGIFLVGLLAAATVIPIGGAVIGTGEVGVASHVKHIAHPMGGVVTEVLVADGDHVVKGQPLLRLDNQVSGTDASLSALSVNQLLAQRARLEAERLGATAISFPADLASSHDSDAAKAMADETRLFQLHRGAQSGTAGQLEARVRQYREEIAGYNARIAALQQQQALIAPEREGVQQLWRKNLVTIDRVNEVERTAADMAGNIAALRASIAEAEASISEVREQMIQQGQTQRSDAGTQLGQVNATLNQQQIRSISARDQSDRSVVRAPCDGTVDKLAFNTIGGVVKPADPILDVVPDHDIMVVEAMVSPNDIDQVHVGQSAHIRFASFSSPSSPQIAGRVTTVAANRTTDPQAQRSFYTIRVAIDQGALSKEQSMTLRPGMPAEVYIQTGHRSMLSYLTKPLRDQMMRAFRDN